MRRERRREGDLLGKEKKVNLEGRIERPTATD